MSKLSSKSESDKKWRGKKAGGEKRKSFYFMLLNKNFERELKKKKKHHYKNHTQSSQVRNTDKIHEYLRHINQMWSIISAVGASQVAQC